MTLVTPPGGRTTGNPLLEGVLLAITLPPFSRSSMPGLPPTRQRSLETLMTVAPPASEPVAPPQPPAASARSSIAQARTDAGSTLGSGTSVAAGVAAHGNLGISRVEISLDDGATWAAATLEPSINPNFTWVRWIFPFQAEPGTVTMMMRATDTKGTVAPEERNPPLPDGATGWPDRTFRVA